MNRFDRMLGILLVLRGGEAVPAQELARRFEVLRRTVYRDVEALAELGVPVYARRGWEGGFQLLEGYFLPPLMFATGEAVSLLLGLALLHRLPARPFAAELETAERKLLAAVPERLRAVLAHARDIVGFETLSADVFHPEPDNPAPLPAPGEAHDSRVTEAWLQAILDRRRLELRYHSPYRAEAKPATVEPLGLLWDRGRWYLAGRRASGDEAVRLWRADRVLEIRAGSSAAQRPPSFAVRALLDHAWMKPAMAQWLVEAPVKVRLTPAQAERLRQDWYYRHARFEAQAKGGVLMTFGESDPAVVLELLRWLGPGAELLEPAAWRAKLREELLAMAGVYEPG